MEIINQRKNSPTSSAPIITEDIERGFALSLPISIWDKIPHASIAPLGCQKQSKKDNKGNIIPKVQMTHDQTFPDPTGLSVNLRVKKHLLPPILYSYVLSRTIHYIVNTHSRHLSTKICICKVDLDAAFYRCTSASNTATESITIFDNMLLMALRMTFGDAACPALWWIVEIYLLWWNFLMLHVTDVTDVSCVTNVTQSNTR